ncbi:MAG: peptidoglycan editing factor PgeF [Thermoanaerobaculia bacterium]
MPVFHEMFAIEQSALGRIVVPESLPAGKALFYTTVDFDGRLNVEIARQIRALIAERFGIGATLTTCTQVHGAAVRAAKRGKSWRECDSCDALWAAEPNVALGIKVADCLPVTLIDDRHQVVANVHSGWRGAVQQITAATLDAIERRTAFDPQSASAWLGPTIRACCFEVGEKVVEQFAASYGNAARFIDRSREKPHVDIPGLTIDLLRRRGLAEERIFDSGLCTRCNGSIFHSFRREGRGGGRNLAIVAQ